MSPGRPTYGPKKSPTGAREGRNPTRSGRVAHRSGPVRYRHRSRPHGAVTANAAGTITRTRYAPANIDGPKATIVRAPPPRRASTTRDTTAWRTHGSAAPTSTTGQPAQPRNRPRNAASPRSPPPTGAPGSRAMIRYTRYSAPAASTARSSPPGSRSAPAAPANSSTAPAIAGYTPTCGSRWASRSTVPRSSPTSTPNRYGTSAGRAPTRQATPAAPAAPSPASSQV